MTDIETIIVISPDHRGVLNQNIATTNTTNFLDRKNFKVNKRLIQSLNSNELVVLDDDLFKSRIDTCAQKP